VRRGGGGRFPYFGNAASNGFAATDHPDVLVRNVPVKRLQLKDGEALVATVYDLLSPTTASTGLWRRAMSRAPSTTTALHAGLGGADHRRAARADHRRGARFADNAEKTNGKSMVIIGAAMNHWYHMDMNYRGVINMLVMCGCVGQSGGGWAHYVGQEKLRPQSGWAPLAFALDWIRVRRGSRTRPRSSMPTPTSGATRPCSVAEILSPTAPTRAVGER
jgi:nitrate reductase alpha subunit